MSEEKKYYYVEGILHEWEYPDQLVPADTMNLVCPKCSARAGFDARWCGINCLSGGVACQWYKSVEKLTQNEFNLLSDRSALLAVARAARWRPRSEHGKIFCDGDQYLVCVRVHIDGTLRDKWQNEYSVVTISIDDHHCSLSCNDEPWGWEWDDVEYYIPMGAIGVDNTALAALSDEVKKEILK